MQTSTEKVLDFVLNIDLDIPEDCDTTDKSFEDFDAVYSVRYSSDEGIYLDYDFPVKAGEGYIPIEDIIYADMKTDNISDYEVFDIDDQGDRVYAKIRIKNLV